MHLLVRKTRKIVTWRDNFVTRSICCVGISGLLLSGSIAELDAPVYAAGFKIAQPWTRAALKTPFNPIMFEHADPLGEELSPEAVQLSELLGLTAKLRRLMQLNKDAELAGSGSLPDSSKAERNELRTDILEVVEESRLQIDCVQAEIDAEIVVLEGVRRVVSDDVNSRVNAANQAAFRTNGVLWAVAEALDIPTYKTPRLSIPSGSIGIVAGIVPSLFSGYATRTSEGGSYKRQVYPNILTKLFDLPAIPRVDFPGVVWLYVNSNPPGETRTRKEIMQQRWRNDNYINFFKNGMNKDSLLRLTGNTPYIGDNDLLSDKLIMMGQVKAVTLEISKPLLEICMVLRGKKRFPD